MNINKRLCEESILMLLPIGLNFLLSHVYILRKVFFNLVPSELI